MKPSSFKTLFSASASAAALLFASQSAVLAQTEALADINVAPQPLSEALQDFSRQADVVVAADPRVVKGHVSTRLNGATSAETGLQTLLTGTGLRLRNIGANQYVVLAALETVDNNTSGANAANDADAPSDVIIVTARKRVDALENVPLAISALSGDDVSDRQIANITDLVDEVPGVSINYAFGGVNAGLLSIRGVGGADDYKPNGNPSVAFHLDGIYQTSNAYLSAPFFDIERVEVLKGPQGTLYGRNTTAGVVNAITRNPGDELNGYIDVEIGNYEKRAFEGAVGGPIGDNVGLRLAFYAEQGGGFMDGAGAGRFAGFQPVVNDVVQTQVPAVFDPGVREGFGDANLMAGRLTLTADFTPETRLTVKAFASRDRGETQPYDRIAFEDDRADRNAGENSDPYTFFTNKYRQQEVNITGVSGELTHRIADDLNLTILAGAQGSEREFSGNGDGTSFPRFEFVFDEELSQASVEARLADDGDDRFDWIAGAFYVTDTVDFKSTWTSFQVRSEYESPYKQTRSSFAVFGQADYELTEKLIVEGGLRYTTDQVDYQGQNTDFDPWGISTFTTTFGTQSPFAWDREFEDDNVSGKITLQYLATDSLNVFASYGTAYRGGGFDGTSIFTPEETEPFDSETVEGFDAGLRYTTDRFRFALDAFIYEFKELQATARLANDTNGRTNVGEAETAGVEASIAARLIETPSQTFDVRLSGAYLDSEITQFSSNRANDVAGTIGDPLPGAPDVTANISLLHSVSIAGENRLDSRIDVNHHGEESNRLNASDGNTSEAYTLLNARTELVMPSGLSLYVFGRNLTDETYFPELNGASRLVGAPLTYGGGVRFVF
ncbi:MAG: TonB-dependent receptor [Pseudomonadota bacterium]